MNLSDILAANRHKPELKALTRNYFLRGVVAASVVWGILFLVVR